MGPIHEPVPASLSGQFRSFEWDVARGRAKIHLTDGRSESMPVTIPTTSEGAGIARMAYSLEDHTLAITTPDGECAIMEIDPPAGTAQHAGHRVVYLDQGHWSALARRIQDPDCFTDQDDAAAADKIIG